MTLIELAERCEKATGPEFSLEVEIAKAVLGWPEDGVTIPRNYTVSLDAAMTLVPEGWLATVKELWDGAGKAASATLTEYSEGFWKGDATALGSTPALALCAAALRARAQQEEVK